MVIFRFILIWSTSRLQEKHHCAHEGKVAVLYPASGLKELLPSGPDGNSRIPVLISLAVFRFIGARVYIRFPGMQVSPFMPSLRFFSSQPGWRVSCYCKFIDSTTAVCHSLRLCGNVVYVVSLTFAQQSIDRTRHLVRHRHSGNVDTAPLHQCFGPATGMILFLVDIP